MTYLLTVLIGFIVILFITQLIFFELTRKKMKENRNIDWFLSLDKTFHYNRVGYMFFLCLFCYVITSPEDFLSVNWIIFFILFLAMGIVSDAVVQYLMIIYGKKRCHKEIETYKSIKSELANMIQVNQGQYEYTSTPKDYDENEVLHRYVEPQYHIAFLSADQGKLAKEYQPLPEATFLIEPFTNQEYLTETFIDTPIKVTHLTQSGQMPFKDEKIDVVMCQYSNYDKNEMKRVLKPGGYFIVHQNGTTNYKEFLELYMPFRMKGSWDCYACSTTLEDIGMQVVEKYEDYGTITFHDIQSVRNYFYNHSRELSDVNKFYAFYMNALLDIREKGSFELSTHNFLVVAKKM